MAKNGVGRLQPDRARSRMPASSRRSPTRRRSSSGWPVMDSGALALHGQRLPIHVFNMDDERNIDRIVCGERVGTVVRSG